MTIALWCVLVAALMHLPFAVAAKSGRGYDNARPRDYLATVDGWRKRANAAQLNSIEVFAPFAAAVIIAQMLHADQNRVDALALSFIALRLLFCAFYLADRATLRSLTWVGGMGCVIALFVIAA